MKSSSLKVLSIATALALFSYPIAQGAANTPGSKCTKVGALAKSGATPVKCVKSGKKSIWQKIVTPKPKASTPATTATTQPSTNPSPSATPENSQNPQESNQPPMPGNPCSLEGEVQKVGTGSIACTGGTWQPVNNGNNSGGPGNTTAETKEITQWGYLSSITSGNGLGNVSDAALVEVSPGTIRVYFKNGNDTQSHLSGFDNFIHSALSTDSGKTWTVESGVRMQVTSPVEVLPKTGGGFQAWGWAHSPSGDSMYYAESADGLTFTPITIAGLDISKCKTSSGAAMGPLGDPAIVKLANGTWLLHAQGFGVGNTGPTFARWACVATSTDGKNWTPVQSLSYGGNPDVETNPNIYMNKSGQVEWMWPSPLGVITKLGDGSTYGDSITYIKAGDPERLDLSDGTELFAMGGFDDRAGGVITFAKRLSNSYNVSSLMGGPSSGGSPNSKLTWKVSGTSEAQITVWNFCLNKKVSDISGATVAMTTVSGSVTVVATDPANTHSCVGILVGPEKIIG